jgi:hypothetical protein
MDYGNGVSYHGNWVDGVREGSGVLKETIQVGTTNAEVRYEVYEGQWENNQRHGVGKMKYFNGTVYEGQWR